MNTYNIYKKKDGQEFIEYSKIQAINFEEAKRLFTKEMVKIIQNENEGIMWLYKKDSQPVSDDALYEFDDYNAIYLMSYKEFSEGFEKWNYNGYNWEIRDNE